MSYKRFLTVSCSTKRGSISSGMRSAAATNLTGLYCAALMPVGDEARNADPTLTPAQQWETFLDSSPDIDVGDEFIVASVTYRVVTVGQWPWADGTTYTRLVLERLKDGSS